MAHCPVDYFNILTLALPKTTNKNMGVISSEVLLLSIVFKVIAMLLGIIGNASVIIYTVFVNKEKTASSYLVANLALADILMCLTTPIWIAEFVKTLLDIESDQDLFCNLSRSTIWALLFASASSLIAITVDRYLYIVKPLRYAVIVKMQRVFVSILAIWLASCCRFIVSLVHCKRSSKGLRSLCEVDPYGITYFVYVTNYLPLAVIVIFNFFILLVAESQRKRLFPLPEASPTTVAISDLNGQNVTNHMNGIRRFFRARKAVQTFSIVVAMLAFCLLTPAIIGKALNSCSNSCLQVWFVIFNYEFYGINSIVNAFIYGIRHIKYRKAYRQILLSLIRCNRLTSR